MNPELGATEILANLSIGYIVFAAFILTVVRLALAPSRGALARSVTELVESLIIAGVLVFMIIRPFFLQAFYIPSESMEPTLMGHQYPDSVHDHIFVNKLIYRLREPRRGEIIVFRAETKADRSAEEQGRKPVENVLIKRLIGIPGDTIEVKPDAEGKVHLYRNNDEVKEAVAEDGVCKNAPHCIKEEMLDAEPRGATFGVTGKPIKLAPGELFVMGDNRNNSNDSRYWGTLPRNRVIGKAELIFWPLNRIRLIH